MVFCTAVLGRWTQLKAAMLYNCSVLYTHRRYWRWCIVTFEYVAEFVTWARTTMGPWLDSGMVVIASGGEWAWGRLPQRARRRLPLPSFVEVGRFEAVPNPAGGNRQVLEVPGQSVALEWEPYWSASVCKNSAHQLAWEMFGAGAESGPGIVHCTLDGDNMVPPDYLEAILEHYRFFAGNLERGGIFQPGVDCKRDLTGRLAFAASVWKGLGGYDEDMLPSSVQDVDLRRRIARYTQVRYYPGEKLQQQLHGSHKEVKVGGTVANLLKSELDAGLDPKQQYVLDRGDAKVSRVDPTIFARFPSWEAMKTVNYERMKRHASGDVLRLNLGKPEVLGAIWVHACEYEEKGRLDKAKTWEVLPELEPRRYCGQPAGHAAGAGEAVPTLPAGGPGSRPSAHFPAPPPRDARVVPQELVHAEARLRLAIVGVEEVAARTETAWRRCRP